MPRVRAAAENDDIAGAQVHDFSAVQNKVDFSGKDDVIVCRLCAMCELSMPRCPLRDAKTQFRRHSLTQLNSLNCLMKPDLCS